MSQSEHTKPFFYFLSILLTVESPILFLGILGIIFDCRRNEPVMVFVSLWTVMIIVVYSLIPYKTPWLVLNLILPLSLLAGKFIESLRNTLASTLSRTAVALIILLIMAQFAWASVNLSFVNYDNDDHKLVYVQSVRDTRNLVRRIMQLTAHYSGRKTQLLVTSPDHWPLPWYLRKMSYILWYEQVARPLPFAHIIIARQDQEFTLENRLKGTYEKEHYQLRPGVWVTLYYHVDDSTFREVYRFTKPVFQAAEKKNLKPGLRASVFSNSLFSGKPTLETIDTRINFAYHRDEQKPCHAPFSVIWSGYLFVPESGNYRLITESDDGSWIYVNGTLVVDNGGEHPIQRKERTAYLEKGYHWLVVKYFDQYFGAIMRLKWQRPGQNEEILPEKYLVHLREPRVKPTNKQ